MTENKMKILGSYVPLVLILCAFLFINLHKPLKTMKVTKAGTTTTLYFASVTNPLLTVSVLAPQDGTLINFYTDYGAVVKKNDVLFVMKSPTLETGFRQGVEGYLKAKAAKEKALFNYNGNQELYKLGLIAKTAYMDQQGQLKDSEYALLDAEQQIKNILLTMGMSFSQIQNLSVDDIGKVKELFQSSLGGIKIVAPASGVLLFSSKTLGTGSAEQSGPLKVGAQVRTGQALGVIANMSGLILQININETDFHAIHVGDVATITSSAFQGIELKGKISSMDRQAGGDNFNTTPTYIAYVKVHDLPQKARDAIEVGMTAQVALARENPPTIKIPITAVVSRNGSYFVRVVNKDTHKVQEVEVTPGVTDATSVQIVKGLTQGDEIVLPD